LHQYFNICYSLIVTANTNNILIHTVLKKSTNIIFFFGEFWHQINEEKMLHTYNTFDNSGTVLTPKYTDTFQIIQHGRNATQLVNSRGPEPKKINKTMLLKWINLF
jgi:hypothetical protein